MVDLKKYWTCATQHVSYTVKGIGGPNYCNFKFRLERLLIKNILSHKFNSYNAKAVRLSNLNHPGKKKKVPIQHNFYLYLKLLCQAQTISGKSINIL